MKTLKFLFASLMLATLLNGSVAPNGNGFYNPIAIASTIKKTITTFLQYACSRFQQNTKPVTELNSLQHQFGTILTLKSNEASTDPKISDLLPYMQKNENEDRQFIEKQRYTELNKMIKEFKNKANV